MTTVYYRNFSEPALIHPDMPEKIRDHITDPHQYRTGMTGPVLIIALALCGETFVALAQPYLEELSRGLHVTGLWVFLLLFILGISSMANRIVKKQRNRKIAIQLSHYQHLLILGPTKTDWFINDVTFPAGSSVSPRREVDRRAEQVLSQGLPDWAETIETQHTYFSQAQRYISTGEVHGQ